MTRETEMAERALERPHKWIRSTLGHGGSMCEHCCVTMMEATVLGTANHCDKAPEPRTPPADETLVEEALTLLRAYERWWEGRRQNTPTYDDYRATVSLISRLTAHLDHFNMRITDDEADPAATPAQIADALERELGHLRYPEIDDAVAQIRADQATITALRTKVEEVTAERDEAMGHWALSEGANEVLSQSERAQRYRAEAAEAKLRALGVFKLVIESAVRNADPKNYEAVMALVRDLPHPLRALASPTTAREGE